MKNKSLFRDLLDLVIYYIFSVVFLFLIDKIDDKLSILQWMKLVLWLEGMYILMTDIITLFEALRKGNWRLKAAGNYCNLPFISITLPIVLTLFIIFLDHTGKISALGMGIVIILLYNILKVIDWFHDSLR